jgi:site-specific DNA recombinase
VGAKLCVDERQAQIIQKIFNLYADEFSIKAVTKQLNRDHIESPRPRPGRQQSWAPSSVRHVLQNERYRGVVTYGRTKKIRNPQSGKRVYRRQPESGWVRVETPEQRIVSDELFARVQARSAFVLRAYGDAAKKAGLLRSRLADSPYIFSGILKCSVCGGSFSIVAGASGRRKYAVYGCAANAHRRTCGNSRRIGRDVLERELLAKLQASVLSPAAITYVLGRLELELSKRFTRIVGMVPRARIGLATPAFSGPRSTGELPRHRWVQ